MFFEKLQSIGKALMTPVAVLPVAGLLLRLGAKDVFDIEIISRAGGAIFDNLPALFAIGIAYGITKDDHGAAAISGYIGYTVLTEILKVIDANISMGILAGLISGLVAGSLYNRYHTIKLPDWLGFFGGSRFIPIITALSSIFLAIIFGFIWVPLQNAIQYLGNLIITLGSVGAFVYGLLNRLLIPFGLHHILNSFIWFVFGEYTDPSTGAVATGDLNRFFAGDPSAGVFMAGFFPVMMFGLPAVCLAIYKTAEEKNRAKISGALISIAFTSFLTGITEPIEFSFMFLAPELYFLHAIFTGFSMAICYHLDILTGFGFSAGVIDYILNFDIATHPLRIIPLGLIFAAVYYFVFRWTIEKFDLLTPGRYDDDNFSDENLSDEEKIFKLVENLGGKNNFVKISNCATRLRLTLNDANKINEDGLKKLGALGVIRKENAVQVIIGTQAEHVANDIKNFLRK